MGNFLDQPGQVLSTFRETPSPPRLEGVLSGRGSTPGGRPDWWTLGGGHFSPEK